MSEIYLVGGTTARTDLDNYVSANISEETAIASMRRWQDYQGSHEDYHIDHIKIDDMAEHDSELLDKVAEKFIEWDSKVKGTREDGVCFFTIENILKGIEEVKEKVTENEKS